ncbi:MAG: phosphotransferase, partial [Candidatus Binatia bacterium]
MSSVHGARPPAAAELAAFERPRAGTREASEWAVAWWRRVWQDDALEDHPMIRVAFDWCAENAPATDRISFLHGDYRTGNFLFDPETDRVTAVLDWEMSRFADRHEDLGWTLARIYTAVDASRSCPPRGTRRRRKRRRLAFSSP